jgi:hypothetical protein
MQASPRRARKVMAVNAFKTDFEVVVVGPNFEDIMEAA